MLREIKAVSQIPGEPFRRWFVDDLFDLTVWFASKKQAEIVGFQLLYPDGHERKAFTWRHGKGYSHHGVDEGESRPGRPKQTPVMLADGFFYKDKIVRIFSDACREMEGTISEFVIRKLNETE